MPAAKTDNNPRKGSPHRRGSPEKGEREREAGTAATACCMAAASKRRVCLVDDETESEELAELTKAGELPAHDHATLGNRHEEPHCEDEVALIVHDSATKWIDCYPSAGKSQEETTEALQEFVGPKDVVVKEGVVGATFPSLSAKAS